MDPQSTILETASDSDADPIISSYNIYVKPRFQDGSKKVYILKFPNRDAVHAYSTAHSSLPLELRLKEKSGLLELDVPLDTARNYDREKGVRWGEVMRKSDLLKGGGDGGSLGLAGGFGIGGGGGQSTRPLRGGRSGAGDGEEVTQEELMRDFETSVAQGRLLQKQTLGGQVMPKDGTTPQYMIGAFKNHELHLTPVDQVVQLRPQFHHIDAAAEIERRQSREPNALRSADPRAIHMTVKPTADGEEETTDTMAERIRAVQEEPWRKMRYVDEDSMEAWELYKENLFVENTGEAPHLVSSVSNTEYLDTISAPRAPEKLAKLERFRKKT